MNTLRGLVVLSLSAIVAGAQPTPRPPKPAEAPRPPVASASPAPLLSLAPHSTTLEFDHLQLSPSLRSLEFEQAWEQSRLDVAQRKLELDRTWQQQQLSATALAPGMGLLWGRDAIATVPPPAWRRDDQSDSTYRRANDLLVRGEYRRAAEAFAEIASKSPNSVYAPDALYWQAFALYRIGGTTELRSALEALEAQNTKYPSSRTRADARTLTTRIRGALAARGDARAAEQIRDVASDSVLRCDREEQSVRVEALSALANADPDGALPVLQRALARRDDCSENLRRTAIFLIASKRRDAQALTSLTSVIKNDPSVEVRIAALEWLPRFSGDDGLSVIDDLVRSDADERMQRAAVRALVAHPSARARQMVRGIVERNETPERLRLEALSAFDKERTTNEDVVWMRALYNRTDNAKIKSRLVSALSRIGGPEVDQWLLALARDPNEESETRTYALRRVAETQPVAELAKLYDGASQRSVRELLIGTLARRSEAEATDKLLDIVKTGTDPQLRRSAISALTQKKDPRTMRLLMELIDK